MYTKSTSSRSNAGGPLVQKAWHKQPLYRFMLALTLIVLAYLQINHHSLTITIDHGTSLAENLSSEELPVISTTKLPQCPAQLRIAPKNRTDITDKNVNKLFKSKAFHKLSVDRLVGAVQIHTETFQDMGRLGEDKRWDNFYKLEEYFRKTFPLLHEKLNLEVVQEHGLLYTWQGSQADLKPILLMGHQDTVPVAKDTLHEWTYPPFSGHFDGKFINGRGASDCKNNVIAILSSITALSSQDFRPRRTVLIAFGFDEETGIYQYGASTLAARIQEVYGNNSLAIVIDEGAIGVVKQFGRTFAIPQAGEKGYFDAELTVHVPGGHSSIPPKHTSIGILADAITVLEDTADKNFPLSLTAENPFYTYLQCVAHDHKTNISDDLRSAILDPKGAKTVLHLLQNDGAALSTLHTTQAVTIFNAGNKANALPNYAKAIVNYRVSSEDGIAVLIAKLKDTLSPVAKRHNLTFTSSLYTPDHPPEIPEYTHDFSYRPSLEPSPISSTNSSSWRYFSGVIKHVFDERSESIQIARTKSTPGEQSESTRHQIDEREQRAGDDGRDDIIVAPVLAGGNTDTRYFWNLSEQIYRFGPYREWHDEGWGGIHDVNERISLDAHLESILFFHEFIRVFDEADL